MKSHKGLIVIVAVVGVIGALFGVRSYNLSKKEKQQTQEKLQQVIQPTEELTTEEAPTPSYESSLNKKEDKKNNSKVDKVTTEDETLEELVPNFDVTCNVFGQTKVPVKNVDGSSCKAYLDSIYLADFDTYWGTSLDVNDMKSTTKHLVGVDQDNIEEEVADLQSVGWLISNFEKLDKHDAIKFTNLHVIGSLSDSHVAVLCSYDWYSAYGLKDTLVLFEDISGTLTTEDFIDGAIFSATAFVHNIKVVNVKGQNVVCVQYNVFK